MPPFLFLFGLIGHLPSSNTPPDWNLLSTSKIQHELRLSTDQVKQIQFIRRAGDIAMKKVAKASKRRHEILDPAQPKLKQLGLSLSQSQQTRLWQITLQAYGPYVYDAKGMPTALGLNDVDIERIGKVQGAISLFYMKKVEFYVKEHKVPYHLVGGDMMVPVETPEIRRMNAERDTKLTVAMHQSLSKSQNDRLAKLLGPLFHQ
jgi:hypothetical protein